jgi:predicted alpha/beta hydrolase family esterase
MTGGGEAGRGWQAMIIPSRRANHPACGGQQRRLWAGALAAALTAACAHTVPLGRTVPDPFVRTVTLYGHPLALHLSTLGGRHEPLLVYATGDGGWRGYDLDMYRHLVSWGYPVAGFSAPEYIKYLRGEDETTTPVRLATDYKLIVELAKRELRLPPDTPVILVGVSRGAGLSVVAAGQRLLQSELAGVLAVALTREEEHVRFRRMHHPPSSSSASLDLQTYEYLPNLDIVPLDVIQSTNDSYLPAAEARELFGRDTDHRRLIAIESRNHSFTDAREELYAAMEQSLQWLRRSH